MGAAAVRVLAFDCSTAVGSVAVVAGDEVIFTEAFACPRGRGGEFFPALERAVRAAGRLDRVAVGIGPGSYNGLRAAIAAAEALHLARGVPRVGLASPRAMGTATGEFFALGDARGGTFWLAKIRAGELIGAFELLTPEALRGRLDAAPALPRFSSAPPANLPGVAVATPDAIRLARLARKEPAGVAAIEPLYLKPAHITAPRAQPPRNG